MLISSDLIYDMIMSEIDPELMTSELPLLDFRYSDETAEEHDARMKRYASEFEEYERRLKVKNREWDEQLRRCRSQVMRNRENRQRLNEDARLRVLEENFK